MGGAETLVGVNEPKTVPRFNFKAFPSIYITCTFGMTDVQASGSFSAATPHDSCNMQKIVRDRVIFVIVTDICVIFPST